MEQIRLTKKDEVKRAEVQSRIQAGEKLYFVSIPEGRQEGSGIQSDERGSDVEWNIKIKYTKIKQFDDMGNEAEIKPVSSYRIRIEPPPSTGGSGGGSSGWMSGGSSGGSSGGTSGGSTSEEPSYEVQTPAELANLYMGGTGKNPSDGSLLPNWKSLLTEGNVDYLISKGNVIFTRIPYTVYKYMLALADTLETSEVYEGSIYKENNGAIERVEAQLHLGVLLRLGYDYVPETREVRKNKNAKIVFSTKKDSTKISSTSSISSTSNISSISSQIVFNRLVGYSYNKAKANQEITTKELYPYVFWKSPIPGEELGRTFVQTEGVDTPYFRQVVEKEFPVVLQQNKADRVLETRTYEDNTREDLVLRKAINRYELVRKTKSQETVEKDSGLQIEQNDDTGFVISFLDSGVQRKIEYSGSTSYVQSIPDGIYKERLVPSVLGSQAFTSTSYEMISSADWDKVKDVLAAEEKELWEESEGNYTLKESYNQSTLETALAKLQEALGYYSEASVFTGFAEGIGVVLLSSDSVSKVEQIQAGAGAYFTKLANEDRYYQKKGLTGEEKGKLLAVLTVLRASEVFGYPYVPR